MVKYHSQWFSLHKPQPKIEASGHLSEAFVWKAVTHIILGGSYPVISTLGIIWTGLWSRSVIT